MRMHDLSPKIKPETLKDALRKSAKASSGEKKEKSEDKLEGEEREG